MLSLFRKYQRYIYLVVTVVIIISFSFFGTYSTLGSNQWREQIAFKAVDGKEVTRYEVEEMSHFISTDQSDKIAYGGAWGPNFLNDGVIVNDFLKTGLAKELLLAYSSEVQPELLKRWKKEKNFQLYVHPNASFISVEQAWNYFSPKMTMDFEALRKVEDPVTPAAINHRIDLYLAQKEIPSAMIRKILQYQEQQFDWLSPDPTLNQRDFALFGYHSFNDWFGPQFTALVSQFIINAAILAEDKGYKVSRAEAMADLAQQAQVSYSAMMKNGQADVVSLPEYFNEQLRLLNMDKGAAIRVWQQVLLFRRYFQDAGGSALIDTLALTNFDEYASEQVKVKLYHLPSALRLSDSKELQNFAVYLKAAADLPISSLELPKQFLTPEEVEKNHPELVQKCYTLEVAHVNSQDLETQISLKEIWKWETNQENWQSLKLKFAELGAIKAETVEERYEALEEVSAPTRARIDRFAKEAIIRSRPEQIEKALTNAEAKKEIVGIQLEGKTHFFAGVDQSEAKEQLLKNLDVAPLAKEPSHESPLYMYSADNKNYYRIKVLERPEKKEVLTFAQAKKNQTLDMVKENLLKQYYQEVKEKNSTEYQLENGEWKPYSSIKEQLTEEYFADLWKNLETIQKELTKEDPLYHSMGRDQLVALRFYRYVSAIRQNLVKREVEQVTLESKQSSEVSNRLNSQWTLEEEEAVFSREEQTPFVNMDEVSDLDIKEWSAVKPTFNGDLAFFQLVDHQEKNEDQTDLVEQTLKMQSLLNLAAQRALMKEVLIDLKEKQAISLNYLKNSEELLENQQENKP
mgnify:CR=1 FL=1